MSKPKPAPLPSGTVVGGYQVIKKLAAGGFGVVYLCEDPDRHLVALKEYLPSSLAERSPGELTPRVKPEKQPLYRLGLKSFFEEGRSLAQISHPSVVSVLNFFRENETVYMVMNYLQGDTLQDFIVTARDRFDAVAKLQAALAATRLGGIETNLRYLRTVATSASSGEGSSGPAACVASQPLIASGTVTATRISRGSLRPRASNA